MFVPSAASLKLLPVIPEFCAFRRRYWDDTALSEPVDQDSVGLSPLAPPAPYARVSESPSAAIELGSAAIEGAAKASATRPRPSARPKRMSDIRERMTRHTLPLVAIGVAARRASSSLAVRSWPGSGHARGTTERGPAPPTRERRRGAGRAAVAVVVARTICQACGSAAPVAPSAAAR